MNSLFGIPIFESNLIGDDKIYLIDKSPFGKSILLKDKFSFVYDLTVYQEIKQLKEWFEIQFTDFENKYIIPF